MSDGVIDIFGAVLVFGGAFLSFAAGMGLIRFPDVLTRLHAVTKPQVLGLILIMIGIAVSARSWWVLFLVFPILVFQVLTAPVAAHMVGRAAYRLKEDGEHDNLFKDELAGPVHKAEEKDI